MAKQKKVKGLEIITDLGHTFGGIVMGTGPGGHTKSVRMCVTVTPHSKVHEKLVITPDCVALNELEGQINKLKKDLDWVLARVRRIRASQLEKDE